MKKNFIFQISDKLIVLFLQLWLLVDMANGFLINNGVYFPGGLSLGEVTRIFFLAILILSIKLEKKDFVILSIPYLLISLCLIHYLLYGNDIVRNLNIAVKISLPILIYIFLKNNNYLFHKPHVIRSIIYINGAILLFNLYLSYFGFGYRNYNTSLNLGGTGFFFAGNEVSGALLMLFSLIIFDLRHKPKKVILVTMLFFIAALVLTSRAAIFGTLIIFGFYLFFYKKINKFIVAASFSLLSILMYYFVYDYIIMALTRWSYFIDRTGALVFFAGGAKRLNNAQIYIQEFIEYPFYLLVGKGWIGLAEQDLLDLFIGYGIIGSMVYLVWIYWGFNIYKKLNIRSNKKYVLVIFALILVIATLAGHTVQSAMIAPFIALFANLDLFTKRHKLSLNSSKPIII